MPLLKQISCHVQLSDPYGTVLREHGTQYGDGFVETFIAVPDEPSEFCITLSSSGFIAPGISMFVFMDGQYQCNRNRRGLIIPGRGVPSFQTEVNFVVRQKEHKRADGKFVARPWRFEKLNVVPADKASELDTNVASNIGTIEVVVLRCRDPTSYRPEGRGMTYYSMGNNSMHGPRAIQGEHFRAIGHLDGASDVANDVVCFDGNYDGPPNGYYYGSGQYDIPKIAPEGPLDDQGRRQESRETVHPHLEPLDHYSRLFSGKGKQAHVDDYPNDNDSFCSKYEGYKRLSGGDEPIGGGIAHGNHFARHPNMRYGHNLERPAGYPHGQQPFVPLRPAGVSFQIPAINPTTHDFGPQNPTYTYPTADHHVKSPFSRDVRSNPASFDGFRRVSDPQGSAIDSDSDAHWIKGTQLPYRSMSERGYDVPEIMRPREQSREPQTRKFHTLAPQNYPKTGDLSNLGTPNPFRSRDFLGLSQRPKPTNRFDMLGGLNTPKEHSRERSILSRRGSTETIKASGTNAMPWAHEEGNARSLLPGGHGALDDWADTSSKSDVKAGERADKTDTKTGAENEGVEANNVSFENKEDPFANNNDFQGQGEDDAVAENLEKPFDYIPEAFNGEAGGNEAEDQNDASYGAADNTSAMQDDQGDTESRRRDHSSKTHRRSRGRGRPTSPPIKPYFLNWNRGPAGMTLPAPSTLYTFPEDPVYTVPETTAASNRIEHQVRAGPGAEYTHRTSRPAYIDTFDQPYAVFRFKYRSKAMLKKILGRKVREGRDEVRARLMGMTKEDIVEEMLRAKTKSKSGSGSGSTSEHGGTASERSGINEGGSLKSEGVKSAERSSRKVADWKNGAASAAGGSGSKGASGKKGATSTPAWAQEGCAKEPKEDW